MGVPNLGDEREKHASDGGENEFEAAAFSWRTVMHVAAVMRGTIEIAV